MVQGQLRIREEVKQWVDTWPVHLLQGKAYCCQKVVCMCVGQGPGFARNSAELARIG